MAGFAVVANEREVFDAYCGKAEILLGATLKKVFFRKTGGDA